MQKQPLHPVANHQWHKKSLYTVSFIWNNFKLVSDTSWKLQKRLVCNCLCFEMKFSQKIACYAQVEAKTLWREETDNVRRYAQLVQQLVGEG